MSRFSSLASGRIRKALPPLRSGRGEARRAVLAAVLVSLTLALAACGSGHPRTEVLRSASPLTSDIYLRITGPGGAVSYMAQELSGGAFTRYRFNEPPGSGLFVPPDARDRKLCASTHTIRSEDAPELQKWQGRTLAITVYGKETSSLFCAALGPGLYLGGA
jgi:hypothetical protein